MTWNYRRQSFSSRDFLYFVFKHFPFITEIARNCLLEHKWNLKMEHENSDLSNLSRQTLVIMVLLSREGITYSKGKGKGKTGFDSQKIRQKRPPFHFLRWTALWAGERKKNKIKIGSKSGNDCWWISISCQLYFIFLSIFMSIFVFIL